jgi:hypothetical protein
VTEELSHEDKVMEINDLNVRLTDWEAEFIDSMLKRIDSGAPFTPKQAAIIDRIYSEKVS